MHFLSLSYPSGSLTIRSALGLSLFERGDAARLRASHGARSIGIPPRTIDTNFAHQPYFLINRLRVSAQGLSGASLV
jgi:hypothetical protein